MIIKIDTENLKDVEEAVKALNALLQRCDPVMCDKTPKKRVKKEVKTEVKTEVKEEPQLEIEESDSPFDDDETEITEADIKKALNAYAKSNSPEEAKKIVKQYSTTGKLGGVAKEDYAALLVDLS